MLPLFANALACGRLGSESGCPPAQPELALALIDPLQLGVHGAGGAVVRDVRGRSELKIWNNTRIEMNLEQNQQLLLKARMDALTSQINPHFLFNTLNTVSSLIRFDPDMARGVVLKLSVIRGLCTQARNIPCLIRERAGLH